MTVSVFVRTRIACGWVNKQCVVVLDFSGAICANYSQVGPEYSVFLAKYYSSYEAAVACGRQGKPAKIVSMTDTRSATPIAAENVGAGP